jgi:hypothetical protein
MQVEPEFEGLENPGMADALYDALFMLCQTLPESYAVAMLFLFEGCETITKTIVLASNANYWMDSGGFWGEVNGVTFNVIRAPFVASEQASIKYRVEAAPSDEECPDRICHVKVQRGATLGYHFPEESGPEQKYWGWHTVQEVDVPMWVVG